MGRLGGKKKKKTTNDRGDSEANVAGSGAGGVVQVGGLTPATDVETLTKLV